MVERDAVLILGCDEGSVQVITSCLESRNVEAHLTESPAAMVRGVLSLAPVAVVLGVNVGSDLESIEMIHAVDRTLPVIAVTKEDSIELERRAREARVFFYIIEPVQEEEFAAVIDDVFRCRTDG